MLHEIIRSHPDISGFVNTRVPEYEGQHLQSVYQPASSFGGPGRFAFDVGSRMDKLHPLATRGSARLIFDQWRAHYDMSREYLVEKSPPNIVRTRFLQKLFPDSKFIFILRHPLAVSYATRKWSGTSVQSLFKHYLMVHEIMMCDLANLHSAYILKYEALVADPPKEIDRMFGFLGLSPDEVSHEVTQGVNDKYFQMWERDQQSMVTRELEELFQKFEIKMNRLGYSLVV